MRAHELTVGRTFGVTFDHGEDFFEALSSFCRDNGVRQGYIPSFIGAFAEAEIVGACEKLSSGSTASKSTSSLSLVAFAL
ncbi:PCC domain-containing protein [Streptomyces triticisoli]|uniref:PCC domain-containing protein n=1 Tax=Streptomyces triticisoli TaxID=2182797 RepID=UPI001E36FB10|nr:DUF296 domain-containing protein [Streptomyces triticisoli]